MKEHTTGPWEIVGTSYPSIKQISGPSFKVTAVLWATDLDEKDYQKRMADMRLIAAAPDLLEALEELVDLFGGLVSGEYPPDGFTTQPARDAIAKARGESNE